MANTPALARALFVTPETETGWANVIVHSESLEAHWPERLGAAR